MKVLKWILYIVLAIIALILIIPLFMPGTVTVTAEKDVPVHPEQVFHNAALYTERDQWDPWLTMEPTAEVKITPEDDYVGSRYYWNGEKIGSGEMMVDSVVFGKYIASEIRFGDNPDPSLVEWTLEPTDEGAHIKWRFTAEGAWPFEKLMLNMMKGSMKSSFETGLKNYAEYLESNPPALSKLGPIEEGVIQPMTALVTGTTGTIEEIASEMGNMYAQINAAIEDQGLTYAGMPFAHYTSFDQAAGINDMLAGIPIVGDAQDAGDVKVKIYPEISTIQAMHTGPYEDLTGSYDKFMQHLTENEVLVTGEAFEFYLTDPAAEPNVTRWQTLIAFPLR